MLLPVAFAVSATGCAAVSMPKETPMTAEVWGGDRANMTVGAESTRIEFDCGLAVIPGTLKPDAKGVFAAAGYFEEGSGGPVNPDAAPKRLPTKFKGVVAADTLDLTMQVSGEAAPRHLKLARGQRVKLIRCL